MCSRSGASPRCLQFVLQGVYEDVWGSWLVSICFIDVMNVQHMHWRCHKTEFEVSMCIRSDASPRCLQIVLQGVYEDVWGSWLVSIGFIDVMNVQHMHWRCHKPNLKSLCASEVVLLQGVSKSSSKESKRTSGVPGWCQLVSLMS